MSAVHLLAALCLLTPIAAQDQEANPTDLCPPGPARGLGGLGGVSTVSALRFPEQPDALHRFETVYVHPDRARWRRVSPDGRARRMSYRFGARVWDLAEDQDQAVELRDAARAVGLLELELRRATLLWPLGFAWTDPELPGSGPQRIAPVPRCDGRPEVHLGFLVAELDDARRPLRVRALDLEDREVAALVVHGWEEHEGRAWPRELVLEREGAEVWRETIEEVRSRVFLVDAFFLPSHLQPRNALAPRAMQVPLFAITFRAHPVPATDTWPAAIERCRRWIEAAREELAGTELRVDPVPCLELSAEGRPLRALVRLAEPRESPPEGWTTRPAGSGLATFADGLAELGPEAVGRLVAALPSGREAGVPYCRLVRDAGPRSVQLYLPYTDPEPAPEADDGEGD